MTLRVVHKHHTVATAEIPTILFFLSQFHRKWEIRYVCRGSKAKKKRKTPVTVCQKRLATMHSHTRWFTVSASLQNKQEISSTVSFTQVIMSQNFVMCNQSNKYQISMRHSNLPKFLPNGGSNTSPMDVCVERFGGVGTRTVQPLNTGISTVSDLDSQH